MDLQDYQTKAKRTMNWELPRSVQLSNFALGIVGELGEVAEILDHLTETEEEVRQITDEAGDIFWYVANLCTFLETDWRDLFPKKKTRLKLGSASNQGFRHAAKIADTIKKTIAQGHDLRTESIIHNLKGLMDSLTSILVYYALTPQEVCAYNHTKLLRRYPDGFRSEDSIHRE